MALIQALIFYIFLSAAHALPHVEPRESCENTATSRSCWGEYNIDTNYYEVFPSTGVVREYWLTVQNTTLAPDGYERPVTVFNGTYPGPTIEAYWGDTLVIHVKNELENNGTSVHWHGIRLLNNNQNDGVPGVTQCPIAPGETMTYTFNATQYGTSWYHSHLSLQLGDGLYGPLIIHGPATANYDIDLGPVHLTDWFHGGAFAEWQRSGMYGGEPLRTNSVASNGLINGTNTYDCSGSKDANCKGTGKRNVAHFEPGKKHLIRVIDSQIDSSFSFSIDGHNMTIIAMDFVPIVPYTTDHIAINGGQRYDIIVEANQGVGNYWMRAIYQMCSTQDNENKDNIKGIVRYKGASDEDPTTMNSPSVIVDCGDEPYESLVPHVAIDVGPESEKEELLLAFEYELSTVFHWTLNTKPLTIDWSKPTNQLIENGTVSFPAAYNIYDVNLTNKWTYWILQQAVFLNVYHPFHLHGHDLFVLAQGLGAYTPLTSLNLKNPPRRDTATMPGDGYMVIAFKTDNPGSWMFHCHIAWHASQNLALQFVERKGDITSLIAPDSESMKKQCASWDAYVPTEVYRQDDSGI